MTIEAIDMDSLIREKSKLKYMISIMPDCKKIKGMNPIIKYFYDGYEPKIAGPTRDIDSIASFSVFGIDVKITPSYEVKVIEVNGVHSGMKGFEKAGEDSEMELNRHMERFGDSIGSIAEQLTVNNVKCGRLTDAARYLERGDLFYGGAITPGSAEERLAEKIIKMEAVLEDKLLTDELFDGIRHVKTRTYEYIWGNIPSILSTKPRYVVIKPAEGSRGENVLIIKAQDMRNAPEEYEGMVAEAFIPSKPILSETDGRMHDGCMRYVVFVEESKEGKIDIMHFGGYWRLCPAPLTEDLCLDAMRANLAQGAIAEKASQEDKDKVRQMVDMNIPTFYRNLLRKAN